jgi:hypothetical protein
MDHQPPVRKKWAERQFDLFIEVTQELGQGVSKDDFESVLDKILPANEPQRKPRKRRRNRVSAQNGQNGETGEVG